MTDSAEPVLLDVTAEGVAFVTLNRPAKHNAFDEEMIAKLADAFETLKGADHVRIVFIRGNGPSFCAGADIEWMKRSAALTDANAAIFDAAHHFKGCIPGIHEILRRQGLLAGLWCLNPHETLSPGQSEEIDRIWHAYPDLRDTEFVEAHLDEWLR